MSFDSDLVSWLPTNRTKLVRFVSNAIRNVELAEDIVQDALESCLRWHKNYNGNIAQFVIGVVKKYIHRYIHWEHPYSYRMSMPDTIDEGTMGVASTPEDDYLHQELMGQVLDFVTALRGKQQAAALSYMYERDEGLTQRQVNSNMYEIKERWKNVQSVKQRSRKVSILWGKLPTSLY